MINYTYKNHYTALTIEVLLMYKNHKHFENVFRAKHFSSEHFRNPGLIYLQQAVYLQPYSIVS